jgi:hypothetical protein
VTLAGGGFSSAATLGAVTISTSTVTAINIVNAGTGYSSSTNYNNCCASIWYYCYCNIDSNYYYRFKN